MVFGYLMKLDLDCNSKEQSCKNNQLSYMTIRSPIEVNSFILVTLITPTFSFHGSYVFTFLNATSFNFQYPFISFRSSSSCIHLLLPHLPITTILHSVSYNNAFQKVVPMQDTTNPVSLPYFYFVIVLQPSMFAFIHLKLVQFCFYLSIQFNQFRLPSISSF